MLTAKVLRALTLRPPYASVNAIPRYEFFFSSKNSGNDACRTLLARLEGRLKVEIPMESNYLKVGLAYGSESDKRVIIFAARASAS